MKINSTFGKLFRMRNIKFLLLIIFIPHLSGCSKQIWDDYLNNMANYNDKKTINHQILISNEESFPTDYKKLVIDKVNSLHGFENPLFEFSKPVKIYLPSKYNSETIANGIRVNGKYWVNSNEYYMFSYLVMTITEYKKINPLYKKQKHIKLI